MVLTVNGLSLAFGNHPGIGQRSIYGRNESVGTTWAPLTANGELQLVPPSGAQQLRVRAGGNVNDHEVSMNINLPIKDVE